MLVLEDRLLTTFCFVVDRTDLHNFKFYLSQSQPGDPFYDI